MRKFKEAEQLISYKYMHILLYTLMASYTFSGGVLEINIMQKNYTCLSLYVLNKRTQFTIILDALRAEQVTRHKV